MSDSPRPDAKSNRRAARAPVSWSLVLAILGVTWILMALAIRWAVASGKF